jgi:hypothetical protein
MDVIALDIPDVRILKLKKHSDHIVKQCPTAGTLVF